MGQVHEQALDELVRSAYDAAGSTVRWGRFLAHYGTTFGADAALLVHTSQSSRRSTVEVCWGIEESWVQSYRQYHQQRDAVPHFALGQRAGTCWLAGDSLAAKELGASDHYVDFVRPQGFRMEVCASTLRSDPGMASAVALHTSERAPRERAPSILQAQRRMVGHLQSALGLHQRVVELNDRSDDLTLALEYSGVAVALCGVDARVLLLNGAAEQMLALGDGLTYEKGALVAPRCAHHTLEQALEQAVSLSEGRSARASQIVHVLRTSRKRPFELLVLPLPERQSLHTMGGRALVFFVDPELEPRASHAILRQLYGLTDREARVTQLLAAGFPVPQIAERMAVSRETVRSHLKVLYQKTQTNRQARLVSTVLGGLARIQTAQRSISETRTEAVLDDVRRATAPPAAAPTAPAATAQPAVPQLRRGGVSAYLDSGNRNG